MVCATVPFKAPNMKELHKIIMTGHFSFPCQLTEGIEKIKIYIK